jgi:hypothetical protein
MKLKTPRGIWALRAVTITVALVAIVAVGTIAYSAYQDYTALRSELAGGSRQATGSAVLRGSSEYVSINITVPNGGVYSLNVTLSCSYPNPNVVCQPTNVVVPPGQQGVLRFRMTVVDLSAYESSADHNINGTVAIVMQPFVSLTIVTNFGGFVSAGGP